MEEAGMDEFVEVARPENVNESWNFADEVVNGG
jgi:hypothetical protein